MSYPKNPFNNSEMYLFGALGLTDLPLVSYLHISPNIAHQWLHCLGWRVDNDSPITVATTYRWVTSAVQTDFPKWTNAKSYVICPVIIQLNGVLLYAVHKNGAALSRESHEAIPPGDYGVYNSKGQGF
jgi:hypothetical protein